MGECPKAAGRDAGRVTTNKVSQYPVNRKVATRITLLACLLVLSAVAVSAKAWRGLVPLRSTRADVVRLLGPANDEDGYVIEGERAFITYASHACEEGVSGGWNVPADTVVEIRVTSNREITIADIPSGGKTLEQIQAVHTPQIDYLEADEGVRYTTIEGLVQAITYIGAAEDEKKFSCGAYKYAAPVPEGSKLNRFEQYPFDSYGKISSADTEARLDNFIIQLLELNKEKSNYRGFVLVYAGRSAHLDEAKTVADCAKNYLVKVRQANPDTIIAVDAGYQNEFKVELYIMPNDAYPPMLMPTVSPRKVEILKSAFTPCTNQGNPKDHD